MDKFEKAAELLKDADFMSNLDNMEGVDDLCNAFRENGADLTPEETKMLAQELVSVVGGSKELSTEQLDTVSGGIWNAIKTCASAFATGWAFGKKFFDVMESWGCA